MSTFVPVRGLTLYKDSRTGIIYACQDTPPAANNRRPIFQLNPIDILDVAHEVADRTLGFAIDEWRTTPEWSRLRAKTRLSYERALSVLRVLSAIRLREITRPFLLDLRTDVFRKRGRWMSNYCVTVLRIILGFAVDRGWLSVNPLAERIRKIRKATDEGNVNRPWTEAECKIVLERAPPALKLALALPMCAGLRKSDFLTVTRSAVHDGTIAVRTSKRGTKVAVPLHPILSDALADRPKSSAVQIAVNSYGEPWTEGGFNASWRTFKKRLEAEGLIEAGLTPHGLRHTLGTRLREAGADDRTIADILGQKSVSMARHYSENAALPAHARALVRSLNHTETMLYPHRHAQGGQNGLANLPMSGGDLPERQNARPPSAGR